VKVACLKLDFMSEGLPRAQIRSFAQEYVRRQDIVEMWGAEEHRFDSQCFINTRSRFFSVTGKQSNGSTYPAPRDDRELG
jgi:hypothetical protein